ncbi:MAG: GGDEF domain-containing protein [Nitrospinae bacterium]|nr:GGDEF domain-containing protein [Nitrospinota bacterium]
MDKTRWNKLRNEELIVLSTLLKKQNQFLGDSLKQADNLVFLHKTISLLSLAEIAEMLVSRLPYILSIHYFTLFLYDKDKRKLSLMCHNHPEIKDSFSLHLSESPVMADAIDRSHYILEQNFSRSRYYQGVKNPLFKRGFFVTIPLMIESETVGVLNLNDGEREVFNISDLDFALNIAEFVSLSISNALLYEKTERLSVTDGLTGITNRPQMQRVLQSEFERSTRYDAPLSIIILDLDHFKDVNDTYGHPKGDEVLMALSSLLKQVCRANDVAARYGGEEFLLILPQTTVKGAFKIAERVRKELSKLRFTENGAEFGVTASCGVAELDQSVMKDVGSLVRMADQALYKAKNSGRNRTVIGQADNGTED